MTCNPGDPCYPTSILGRTIKGRSTAGYDVRQRPLVYARTEGEPLDHTMDYYPDRAGVPLTEAEREARHYQRYGTTDLPPRGTGLGIQRLEGPDLGSFVAGVTIGFIIGGMLLTGTGRRIGYRIGERIERRI